MADIPGGSLTLLGVFLMGLGLNLTPCVYPMLSITISLFGTQKEVHHWRSFFKSIIFVLGIATMYSSLGVAAAFTGGIFGALLQNRWVLVGIAALLIALALSMLGVYTFQLPAWIVSSAGKRKAHNLFGIYLSGLFVGVFAAPCVGPPVIALLAFIGTRGDPLFAFQIFFVMSLGLGLPYVILGTFSGLLRKLPRSGVWLIWVERVFGFVLLVLAAFYLALAFNPAWIKWFAPLALIAGGIYLGFAEHGGEYSARFIRFKKTAGMLAVIVGLALPFVGTKETVRWEIYEAAKVAEAKEAKQPVIIDFYADWCIPCHELDQFTYSDPKVMHALEGFRRLKGDLTRPDTTFADEVMNQFQVVGVPTVVFLDQEGKEVKSARVTGFISAGEFLENLRAHHLLPEEKSAK